MPSWEAAAARRSAAFAGCSWSGARRARTADLLLANWLRGLCRACKPAFTGLLLRDERLFAPDAVRLGTLWARCLGTASSGSSSSWSSTLPTNPPPGGLWRGQEKRPGSRSVVGGGRGRPVRVMSVVRAQFGRSGPDRRLPQWAMRPWGGPSRGSVWVLGGELVGHLRAHGAVCISRVRVGSGEGSPLQARPTVKKAKNARMMIVSTSTTKTVGVIRTLSPPFVSWDYHVGRTGDDGGDKQAMAAARASGSSWISSRRSVRMRWASFWPRVAASSVVTAPRSSSARRMSMRRSCSSWTASGSSSGSSSGPMPSSSSSTVDPLSGGVS
jgi:hypothetical protein